MEMIDLDIEMGDDLIAKTRHLAVRYFGDDSEVSVAQVLEVAFTMRCLWSHSVKEGQQETNEAVTEWEFPQSLGTKDNNGTICEWLFRR